MRTGWLKDGETWYCLAPGGAMQTGVVEIDGVWQDFDGSGRWLGPAAE